MIPWAAISKEIIEFIRPWAISGICEVGAGDGVWVIALRAAGIPTVGYDKNLTNDVVLLGDHVTASENHSNTLLIVWPPDGMEMQNWIKAWRGSTVILCADESRIHIGNSLDDFVKEKIFQGAIAGRKGNSTLVAYKRASVK